MAGVVSGAEAWSAAGEPEGSGVLLLHGFTSSPVSMRPLAESLAARGFAVELPRLPGHGTHHRDLQRTTWRDWTGEAAAALSRLRARTHARVAVGLSMGATLALHLAQTRGEELAGVVLINPSIRNGDPRLRLLPAVKWLVPTLTGIGNDIAKPGADEKPYARLPLRALASQQRFQAAVRRDLGDVRVPVLMLTSRVDHVIEPDNAELIRARVASTDVEQIWLEDSYHVATLDYDADVIEQRTADFVSRLAHRDGARR